MMRTPDFWHRSNALSTLLMPFAALYVIGAWLDRKLTKPERARMPVISVGNVTAGGAGKTPTTIALARLLTELGERPHILTRGYGGNTRVPQRVTLESDWRKVGDEPLLLAAAAPCWVARDRLAASADAAEHGASLVIADDALQHHRLAKDISFLVIDGAYGLGNGLPLPAGPLRESFASACAHVHAAILIGEDAHQLQPRLSPLPVFHARLEPAGDVSFLREGEWLAFTGLARPEKFFTTLREQGAELAGTAGFADHHPYSIEDIAALKTRAETLGARLITTEKDMVKLPPAERVSIAVLPVELHFTDQEVLTEWLKRNLTRARQLH